ncbi:cytochrome C [Thioalkalivibrio denitrificans]|uniref:Cytochrome C n=1 Tax=Thioalkalivibrio denitrificans TaxID=108003 RepID=A0A1V3NBQ1_9GAMM|nr:FCSD flavin-binding domain-containing protein [Thioalkalivibrio denitrificans]OOG22475.1 cytochrome C [Thioalkalivibrio denitrificans]
MATLNRRNFLKLVGAAGMAAGLPLAAHGGSHGNAAKARVVVVGGGSGGATAARYVKKLDPAIEVTLIEPNPTYHTCYFSNLVIGGLLPLDRIRHGYDGLRRYGVNVVHDMIVGIDPVSRKVRGESGRDFEYDRLVLSPGIDFKWNAIEGYDEAASRIMPHAWKAGDQTVLLRKQLEAMPDGGVMVLVAPANPFRCPPGPYERASLIANYFKGHKPRSKLLVIDTKDSFSKQGLFQQTWDMYYPGTLEWVRAADTNGGIRRVDTGTMTLFGEFHRFKADMANVIPPQMAGRIAIDSGLADDSGWCPVNRRTFESTIADDVHIIGDAAMATTMPKSGYSASSQAKVAALAVVDILNGREPGTPSYANTCYSFGAPEHAFSVTGVYRLEEGVIEQVAGGVSPLDVPQEFRRREVAYAHSWYNNLTHEMFG